MEKEIEKNVKTYLQIHDAVHEVIQRDGKYYIAENRMGIRKLPYRHIVYIWHEGKYAIFQMDNKREVRVRKTLKEVADRLDCKEFIRIDRSYICNLEHVECIDGAEVLMTNGMWLRLSRGKIEKFKNYLRSYWYWLGQERSGEVINKD